MRVHEAMAEPDVGADLAFSRADLTRMKAEGIKAKRREEGLLLIYPIDKDSEPKELNSKERTKLGAVDHLIGLGIVFPKSKRDTPQEYLTANLAGIEMESVPFTDEEAVAAVAQ